MSDTGLVTVIAALVSMVGVICTPILTYLGAKRAASGRVETTEAHDLWEEARNIREDQREKLERFDNLQEKHALEIREIERRHSEQILELERKHNKEISDLKEQMYEIRRERHALRNEIQSIRLKAGLSGSDPVKAKPEEDPGTEEV